MILKFSGLETLKGFWFLIYFIKLIMCSLGKFWDFKNKKIYNSPWYWWLVCYISISVSIYLSLYLSIIYLSIYLSTFCLSYAPDVKSRLIRKDPDAGKDWGQKENVDRGWGVWMTLVTQWTWVWADSARSWKAGKTDVLLSIELQRVRHKWATEQQQQQYARYLAS